eukprot:scaffold43723_cov15-Tisochrysis_lutea.AAC.1
MATECEHSETAACKAALFSSHLSKWRSRHGHTSKELASELQYRGTASSWSQITSWGLQSWAGWHPLGCRPRGGRPAYWHSYLQITGQALQRWAGVYSQKHAEGVHVHGLADDALGERLGGHVRDGAVRLGGDGDGLQGAAHTLTVQRRSRLLIGVGIG